jgi:hypothetical protein
VLARRRIKHAIGMVHVQWAMFDETERNKLLAEFEARLAELDGLENRDRGIGAYGARPGDRAVKHQKLQ